MSGLADGLKLQGLMREAMTRELQPLRTALTELEENLNRQLEAKRELEDLASRLAHAVLNHQRMTAHELAKRVLEKTDT